MIRGRMRRYVEPRRRLATGRDRDSPRTPRGRRVGLAADTRPEHASSARCGRADLRHASGARAIRRSARVRERGHPRVSPRDRPAWRRAAHSRGQSRCRAGGGDGTADPRHRDGVRASWRHRRPLDAPPPGAGDLHGRALLRSGGVVVRVARVAAGVTRHTDKVDVAGIVFQLSCPFPKPGFWARNHPAFITRRRPDVTVRIDYEHRDGRHGWRSVGDTVADAATVSRRGRNLHVSTGYYRAAVDLPGGRVTVKMAAGFDVAGLMRTLTALWLPERETLLVLAACFGPTGSATPACRLPASGPPSSAASGWVAVRPGAECVDVLVTPFLVSDGPPPANSWRATTR